VQLSLILTKHTPYNAVIPQPHCIQPGAAAMYSPSARLTELISSYLGDFFQSVEKDHLQVRGMHSSEAKERRQINGK